MATKQFDCFLNLIYRNFTHYKNRFSMPGNSDSMMYSFNLGPAHFISFNTEVYYFLKYGIKPMVFQYQWLENDLKVCLFMMSIAQNMLVMLQNRW